MENRTTIVTNFNGVYPNPSFVATVELPGKIQEYRQQIDGETGEVVDEEVVG